MQEGLMIVAVIINMLWVVLVWFYIRKLDAVTDENKKLKALYFTMLKILAGRGYGVLDCKVNGDKQSLDFTYHAGAPENYSARLFCTDTYEDLENEQEAQQEI